MPFFIEFVKQGGLFDSLVADCPLHYTSPNAPQKRDVIGTIFLSVLAGHSRYAHMTTVRCDPVNPLYGHQEGAVVSYNPHKPGWPSHSYHCYMMANLRLVLAVDVAPGNEHTSKHCSPRLWKFLDGLAREQQPWLIRGDSGFGNEPVMREAEQCGQPYLFKLRLTKNVKRAIERAMREEDWQDAGRRWQGKD